MATNDKPSHIKFVLQTFTQEEIDGYLNKAPNFRTLKVSHRNMLLHAMREGWWEPGTGEALAFDDEGRLVNGQHRLSAALIYQRETGKQVWFWCALGVKPIAGRSMDQGASRRLQDYLDSEKVPYASRVAGIALAQARLAAAGKDEDDLSLIANYGVQERPSVAFAIDQWKRNRKAMEYWALLSFRLGAAKMVRSVTLGALGYQLAKIDDMDAKLFFDSLATGASLKEGNPILTLRRALTEAPKAGHPMSAAYAAAIAIKAWNAWRQDEDLQKLSWRRYGSNAEAFPVPV